MLAATRSGNDADRGSDAEVEEFMAKEAEAAAAKPKRGRRPQADEDLPKLFVQMGWSEQRKAGTSAPVLRQVEGDSIRQRLRNYRRSIYFHIHGGFCMMLPVVETFRRSTGCADRVRVSE